MSKGIAISGSPRMEKGYTDLILAPFIQGMREAGSDVEMFHANRLNVEPCACGEMYCWYRVPGECCFKDDMQSLYASLKQADTLILATPVYIPLPGAMQNIINRLCPLIEPLLELRQGRTRARFREDVKIQRIVLVSTGVWWEKANMDTVVRIAVELAKDASVEFAGALLRPHAFLMKQNGKLTESGQSVLDAARTAGYDLVQAGAMREETLEAFSQPLISEAELREEYNRWVGS